MTHAVAWAQAGGAFVYSKQTFYGTKMANDMITAYPNSSLFSGTGSQAQLGDQSTATTQGYYVNIDTKTALIERFYAMYPYLNLSNQPKSSGDHWEGRHDNSSYGHSHMQTDVLVVEGSQNNASYEGLPKPSSVSMKLLVTYLSVHDRVREQISLDNFKDNMPATILMHDTFQEYNGLIYGSSDSSWATDTNQTMVIPLRSKNLAYAISIVAYRNKTNKQLCGGDVYNAMYDGSGPTKSKMDVSMVQIARASATEGVSPWTPVEELVGRCCTDHQIENHQDGDLYLKDRKFVRGSVGGTTTTYQLGPDTESTVMTRWNGRKAKLMEARASESQQSCAVNVCKPVDGSGIARSQGSGPCMLSDPTLVWPNYKVVENFKTVKPTHVKLSIAGQSVYETAQQTALANSYYSTTSDSYTPIKGGGQWYAEKDLDNLPYHYNNGAQTRGDMGSIARLPNILGSSPMGGTIQEHCDAHIITFGLNKTDQLSCNGALGLSSATNAQLELKFAEPCRVSVYVHYHATLQIDSNTGIMSRSLDV